MDSYLNHYVTENISYTIYSYIGLHLLQTYDNIDDCVWLRLCSDFCLDSEFKNKFCTYWIMPLKDVLQILSAKEI